MFRAARGTNPPVIRQCRAAENRDPPCGLEGKGTGTFMVADSAGGFSCALDPEGGSCVPARSGRGGTVGFGGRALKCDKSWDASPELFFVCGTFFAYSMSVLGLLIQGSFVYPGFGPEAGTSERSGRRALC